MRSEVDRVETEKNSSGLHEDFDSMDWVAVEKMRTEVESVDLEAAKVKGPEKVAEVEAVEFLFDRLSVPGLTTVTVGEDASVTVDYSGSVDNNAISSIPLHRSRPSQWQVEVINLPVFCQMVLGIVEYKKPASFSDVKCFGWTDNCEVLVATTIRKSLGDWDGWKAGDKGIFTYSPSKTTLSLRRLRGGGVREFSIHNCRLPDGAFIHFFFDTPGTTVRFSRVV